MSAPLEPIARLFGVDDWLLDRIATEFTAEMWQQRLGEASHALWIVGHIAMCRRAILRKIGGEIEAEGWEKMFDMGTLPGDGDGAPEAKTLLDDFRAVGRRIAERLTAMLPEEAGKETGDDTYPNGSSDLGGYVHFMYWHEAHHIGQVSLIRRALGKPALF